MKFFFFVILSTFIYLSNAACGSQCKRELIPDGILTGDIVVINNKYDVGGTIVVKNDCEFEIQNFYATPQMNAKWYCANSEDAYEGILVSNNVVSLFDKNAPTTLNYDIFDTDPYCHASISQDCKVFRLMSDEYLLIASATLVENANDDENNNENDNTNEDETDGVKDKSGKTSLTWLYVLFGVIGGFALASLLAFGYIQKNKNTKNNNTNNNNNNNNNNEEPPPYCEVIQQYSNNDDITIVHTNTTLTQNDISIIPNDPSLLRNNPSINHNYSSLSRINNSLSCNDNSSCRNFNSLSRIDHSLSHNSISLVNKEKSYKIIY